MKIIVNLVSTTICMSFFSLSLFCQTSPCANGTEYRQMDFWIGMWKVETPDGQLAGHNQIEKILDGCALLENWTGNGVSRGKSLNYFDASVLKWKQKWIDNSGQSLELEGHLVDNIIVFTGLTGNADSGTSILQEMTIEKISENEVHQIWKQSNDRGQNWTIVFDGRYLRIPDKN